MRKQCQHLNVDRVENVIASALLVQHWSRGSEPRTTPTNQRVPEAMVAKIKLSASAKGLPNLPNEWLAKVIEVGTADTSMLAALRLWLKEAGWTEPCCSTDRLIVRYLRPNLGV